MRNLDVGTLIAALEAIAPVVDLVRDGEMVRFADKCRNERGINVSAKEDNKEGR